MCEKSNQTNKKIMRLTKVYLATPYRGIGTDNAYEQVTIATAKAIQLGGYNVFSPITHSHPLTPFDIKGDWDTWKYYDYQFIDWADEVWVLIPKEGIEYVINSEGVQAEIDYGIEKDKLIRYIRILDDGIMFTSNPL